MIKPGLLLTKADLQLRQSKLGKRLKEYKNASNEYIASCTWLFESYKLHENVRRCSENCVGKERGQGVRKFR